MKTFILFLLSTPLFAGPILRPSELTLLAQERAPLIKIYLEQQSMGESQISQSKTLANPIFTYQGGRLKSGSQSGQVTDVTLMQPVPWLGKRSSAVRSQEFLHKIAQMDLAQAKLLLGHRIYLLAFELASLIEVEKHNQERRERFSLIAKYLSSRPLASPKQQLEKDIIVSQIHLVEKLMLEASARKKGILKEISLITGEENFELKVEWDKLPHSHELSYYETHLNDGLRLKKLEQNLRLSENKIDEARFLARPDVLVGVNYRQENVAPVNHFYHGQVSIVIPIVDRGQHAVQTAKAQLRRDEASVNLGIQESKSELAYAFETFLSASAGLKLFPLSLRSESEKRFRKAEEAFRKGQIDVTTFLQSDLQIHANIDLIYSTRLELLASISRLEQLISHDIKE